MTKIHQKYQGHHHTSWEKIAHLLTAQSQYTKSNAESKRLRLKILDTVFLEYNGETSDLLTESEGSQPSKNVKSYLITQWCFTTKKGEAVKRKDPSALTLQHVYDRFCRFSLANATNAAGPRIVAVAFGNETDGKYGNGGGLLRDRINYTAEQFEREAKDRNTDLPNYSSLQCYLRPFEGRDTFYRGVFRLTNDTKGNCSDEGSMKKSEDTHSSKITLKNDVSVQIIDDPVMESEKVSDFGRSIREFDHDISALHKWIQKEVEASVLKIVHHLENVMCSNKDDLLDDTSRSKEVQEPKIITLTADFILDDNKQLWLACIDGVRIGSGEKLIDQIYEVLKESNEQSMLNRNQNQVDVTLPRLVKKEKDESDGVQQLFPPNHEENNNKQESLTSSSLFIRDENTDHGSVLQRKIDHLKSELKNEETAKEESLVQINNLRNEARTLLKLEPLENKTDDVKKIIVMQNGKVSKQTNKNRTKKPLPSNEKVEMKKMQMDLNLVQDENRYLLKIISERGGRDDITDRLKSEQDRLDKQLREEIFKKNELHRKYEQTSMELAKAKVQAKDDVQRLKNTIQSEKEDRHKVLDQMRSANKVLEAEVKVQRDYVHELRAGSWTELATKLKTEVEVIVTQELAKSSMCVSQAVGSCEERWKRWIEEIHTEHCNEILEMKKQFENDLRFRLSQKEAMIEEARLSIEQRLKKEYKQSLDEALHHEEMQRISEIKSEAQKWEQMMMEMKMRIYSEQQQKTRKNLIERDEYWQLKISEMRQEADDDLQKVRTQEKKEFETMMETKESEHRKAIMDIIQEKDAAMKNNQDIAENERLELSKRKDMECQKLVELEREKIMCEVKDEMHRKAHLQKQEENKKIKELSCQMEKLKEENQKDKQSLLDEIALLKMSADEMMETRVAEIQKECQMAAKNKVSETVRKYQHDIAQQRTKHDFDLKVARTEALGDVEEQIKSTKEECRRLKEESLQSLSQEYDEQVQALEYDLSWARSQKLTAEENIETLKLRLAEQEAQLKDMDGKFSHTRMQHGFERFVVIAKALSLQKALFNKDDQMTALVNEAERKHDESEKMFRRKIQRLEKQSMRYEQQMKLVTSILLNHRRDELIQHKNKSRTVAAKIKDITNKIDQVKSKRGEVLDVLSYMEDEMKDVERRLQEHSQVSAIQNGKININHARSKRRLDEEYENVLSKIESKRDGLNLIDQELKELTFKKSEVNDEMRDLERSLVELLVEQQKKLLSISSDDSNEFRKTA